jgi:hypothetical protein
MRSPGSAIIALGSILLAGCDPATSPSESPVAGRWASTRDALNPTGSYQGFLTFEGASYAAEVRNYGLYPGQRSDDLSAYSRIEGTFRVDGDSLRFSPKRLITWDRFYGADSPVHVEDLAGQAAQSSAAHFSRDVHRLTLRYFSYPADAPVATSRTYWRLLHALQN